MVTVKINVEKNPVLPIEKFPFLVLARNTIMLQPHILHFLLHYLSSVRLREVKENFKLLLVDLKVFAVSYKRFPM